MVPIRSEMTFASCANGRRGCNETTSTSSSISTAIPPKLRQYRACHCFLSNFSPMYLSDGVGLLSRNTRSSRRRSSLHCRRHSRTITHAGRSEDQTWDIGGIVNERQRPINVPSLQNTAQDTLKLQLDALSNNDEPHSDHGILLLYNFALFNPWKRSAYFGRLLDLGQFERFRNVLHTKQYRVLLKNLKWTILSSISPSERDIVYRVKVLGFRPGEEGVYRMHLRQLEGGYRDGCWMTVQMVLDDDPLWLEVSHPVSY